ncbi:MAG: glycosyltransferase family 39 protein [Deltaproteobacteria bacterium]
MPFRRGVPHVGVFGVLFFAAALFLRLALVSKGPFHSDTMSLALSARQTLETGRLQYTHGDGHPFAVVVAAAFVVLAKAGGSSDIVFAVNLMSVVFGAVSVALLFLVTGKMFGPRAAAAAGFLGVFFAPHVAVSTFGSSMTLAMSLALASLWFLLRYLQPAHRTRDLAGAAVCLGLCGATRLSEMVFAVPLGFLLATAALPLSERLRSFGRAAILTLGTCLLFFLPLLAGVGTAQFRFVLTNPYQAVFMGPFSSKLMLSFAFLLKGVGLFGCGVSLAGVCGLIRARQGRLLLFLALWFVVFQFLYGNLSSVAMRYLIVGWFPLVILEGYALDRLFSAHRTVLSVSAWVLLGILAVRVLEFLPVLAFRHARSLQIEFARWVGRTTDPKSVIIAVDERQIIGTYGRRPTLGHPTDADPASIELYFRESVDPLLASGIPVYIISSAMAYDTQGVFYRAVHDRYRLAERGARVIEDWHHVLLGSRFLREDLFEIQRKEGP